MCHKDKIPIKHMLYLCVLSVASSSIVGLRLSIKSVTTISAIGFGRTIYLPVPSIIALGNEIDSNVSDSKLSLESISLRLSIKSVTTISNIFENEGGFDRAIYLPVPSMIALGKEIDSNVSGFKLSLESILSVFTILIENKSIYDRAIYLRTGLIIAPGYGIRFYVDCGRIGNVDAYVDYGRIYCALQPVYLKKRKNNHSDYCQSFFYLQHVRSCAASSRFSFSSYAGNFRDVAFVFLKTMFFL